MATAMKLSVPKPVNLPSMKKVRPRPDALTRNQRSALFFSRNKRRNASAPEDDSRSRATVSTTAGALRERSQRAAGSNTVPGGWTGKKPGDDKGGTAQPAQTTDEARRALHRAGASWASGAHAPRTPGEHDDGTNAAPAGVTDSGPVHMPAGASQNLLLGDETVSRLRGERRLDSRDYPTLGRPGDARGGGGGDPASSYAGDDGDYSRHHSRWDEDERGGGGRTDPDRSGRRDHRAPVADRDGWGRERGSYGHRDGGGGGRVPAPSRLRWTAGLDRGPAVLRRAQPV